MQMQTRVESGKKPKTWKRMTLMIIGVIVLIAVIAGVKVMQVMKMMAGFGPPPAMVERLTAAAPLLVSEEGGSAFWRDWLARSPRTPLDARVSQALAAIDRLIPTGSVRLADAAREAGLSLGRFRHLFAEEVGMPFQRHVLWRRMRVAFEALGRRATATEAAHAAGFSDSAHFARTIKAMFGVRATDLLFEA